MRRAALILLSVLMLLAAGCGSSSNDESAAATEATTTEATTTAGRVQRRRGAAGARGRNRDGAEGAARSREDLQARLQDELRLVHGHARSREGARHVGLARLAREVGLLRRHDLPPHRPRLRDPGRRPDPDREAAGPATRRSIRRRRIPPTRRASSRWRRPPPSRPVPPAASSSSSAARTPPNCPPDYAIVGTVTERDGDRDPDRPARRRQRSERDADAAGRDRVGHGRGTVSIGAVVLAAGEASRFGTPKQRLLLPEVLERLEQSSVDEIVVVAGAHTLETPARVVTCAGWKRGPGASLVSGLEELGDDVEAAIVVLADGPDLAPAAVDRVIDVVARRRRDDRRCLVRRGAGAPAARGARGVGLDPGCRPAGARRAARALPTTSAPRATSTRRRICPSGCAR